MVFRIEVEMSNGVFGNGVWVGGSWILDIVDDAFHGCGIVNALLGRAAMF